jgi:8-oxoguanine deaminase
MATLMVRNAELLVTMDEARREIRGGSLLVRDGVIESVGLGLGGEADRVIDASGMLVMPGMVNTHHHLYQTLTRALPSVQDAVLFSWLRSLYPVWSGLTCEAVYVSALVGLSELLLSGCTTASDHLYLFPQGVLLEHEIRAARELGVRFHPCRGSMSLGTSKGGLPPDSVVQDEDVILEECRGAIEEFHDPAPFAMLRIVLAPCSPFSVTADLMRSTVALARQYGVQMHTHVAETKDEEEFCLRRFGHRPVAYMESLGWLGPDVWYAHAVHLLDEEIAQLAETGTGVAHCPSSNMRLGSGIAPVRRMLDQGVRVGLAVDGSASNDSSHMLAEARMAMLLQRVQYGAEAMSAREALELATLGGAAVLGRDDIGSLAPGKAADLVGFDLDCLEYAGALHDPLAALVFCTPRNVSLSIVNGATVVESGQLVGTDLARVIARHNELSRALVGQV